VLIKTGFNGLKDGQDDFCWCGGLMGWIDWVVFKSVKKAGGTKTNIYMVFCHRTMITKLSVESVNPLYSLKQDLTD
jgi:hypothetical protein